MVNCAVPSCKNDSRRQTKQNSNVTFHRFPKNEDLLRKWVDALQRADWEPTIRSFVCSLHFPESSMYFSKSGLRKLVQDAVPELSLENIPQKHKIKRKRKAKTPPYNITSPDDKRGLRKDSAVKDYSLQASDCPIRRKLKKRIMNLTKLSKRRRLRCNALYASLNRIRKKVTGMTQALKDLQEKVSRSSELGSVLESNGVSTTELFKGLWKKERSCSPEPQEEEEEYFYSEIPDDMESHTHKPRKPLMIYNTSIPPLDLPEAPDIDVSVSVVKTESLSPHGLQGVQADQGLQGFQGVLGFQGVPLAPEPVFVDAGAMCQVCLSNEPLQGLEDELREVYGRLAGAAAVGAPALCRACVITLQRARRFTHTH